ncbi:MAG: serine/threonine protein phosphatase [Hyphomonas sp. BRH_c22]|uniref:UDP-2,3-diacylglucosamine diphosphatase n=1 Tax=Hyphomonas sp. BRH_c22 TaxID=1629710 RepID=UPI0005F1B735|nr:UDP-2,3-diacylglucosamine diphosphatase [Hyphomonas sp. BRH_c22]KJS34882.1 MAG: serine/threonine protein phosphatase [Hyphomonas sp. BRH_c22]
MTQVRPKYRAIFISDVHLGSRGSQAEALCAFLKLNTSAHLYLVGDIIDGWRLKKKWYWPQAHTNAIRRILTAAKRGTDVTYIIGNHDEFLRAFMHFRLNFGDIHVKNRAVHQGEDGKRYLVVHGDMFDGMMRADRKWIMHLGDHAYNLLLWVNTNLNSVRRLLGLPYWSLSAALKKRTKRALNYIHNFEDHVAAYCRRKGYDGAICGHIHVAEMRDIDGITYMNDGDWVESCTALVEHHDGRWELLDCRPDSVRTSVPVVKAAPAGELELA